MLGWEIAAVWILVAWLFNITIIGLPLGLWMINRVPQVLTSRVREAITTSTARPVNATSRAPSRSTLLRALYFVFVGWWASLLWAAVGWLFCLTIIGATFRRVNAQLAAFVTTCACGNSFLTYYLLHFNGAHRHMMVGAFCLPAKVKEHESSCCIVVDGGCVAGGCVVAVGPRFGRCKPC